MRLSAGDGFRHGVMDLKPAQQAGGGQEQAYGGLRRGEREAAALPAGLLAVPDENGETGAVDEGQAGQVGNGQNAPGFLCIFRSSDSRSGSWS
jgi:hypothetical protein